MSGNRSPDGVVVFLPNWLGDAAMSTPALRALHRGFPEAPLTVVGRAGVCELVEGLSYIETTVRIPPRPGLRAMLDVRRRLQGIPHELAVVLPHSFRAAFLAAVAGSVRRAGYARGRRAWLLTEALPPHQEDGRVEPVYMAQEYLDLVKTLGAEDDGRGLELHVDAAEAEAARARLRGSGPLIGLGIGAAFGPSKRWPADYFARLADLLHEQVGARCMVLSGPGEEELRDAVHRAARHPLIGLKEAPSTIARMKAVVSQLDLLVSNDSGVRHVGVAFGVPVVCVMGPTSPRYTDSPYERGEVIREEVDCGPCQRPICETDHRCMTHISPERVAKAVVRCLPSGRR